MPSTHASLQFLADLPLYQHEKPYMLLPGADQDIDPEDERLSNLKFESREGITIKDMRELESISLERNGFTFLEHPTSVHHFDQASDVEAYRGETQNLLKKYCGAVKVITYEVRLRKNEQFKRNVFDYYDKLLVEGPAVGAHNDVTASSGPMIVQKYMKADDQQKYLKDGFRVRIVNTWRPLNAVLEDRPLALCDPHTVRSEDLRAADRILPDRIGEIYYLHHQPHQQWYWLEKQKHEEALVFVLYDTMSRDGLARFCPHVSFENERALLNAEKRRSVETRSIVITTC